MNKRISRFAEQFKGKTKDVLILAAIGLILTIAIWRVFLPDETASVGTYVMNSDEERLSYLLSQMDGVGEAEVMICETETGAKNVFVLCEGANDFEVVINIREAVSAAIGAEARNVKIYLKK